MPLLGSKVYYYLEHSLREQGKVIKKEKYIGTSIPKDMVKIKEEFKKELQNELFKKLNNIKEAK